MGKVYITDYIADPHIELGLLKDYLTDDIADPSIEVLLVWHESISKEYLQKFPNLKGVVRYGVGYDAIDLDAIKEAKLVFCNNPDYGVTEVSETALSMLLAWSRGIFEYDFLAKGLPPNWQENTLPRLRRSSEIQVGVIGAGRIGSRFLKNVEAIGFQTAYYDPYVKQSSLSELKAKKCSSLEMLLSSCDAISVHTPLDDSTKGLVDSKFLAQMKFGSCLINTARGGLINSLDDLLMAIDTGRLSGAYLDVLPEEPPIAGSFIDAWRLAECPNLGGRIIVNPHTAYFTQDSYSEMRTKATQNALDILLGLAPNYIICDGRNL